MSKREATVAFLALLMLMLMTARVESAQTIEWFYARSITDER